MGISNSCRAALGLGASALAVAVGANAARAADFIGGDTLLISTTTYQDVGEVANLVAGQSQLPGANAGETSTAVSNGNLNTVWNNEAGDPSFGVTSAISLSDLNVNTGAVLASTTLNPSIVSTSFSSKSELGLNLTKTSSGYVATFMGYAGGGVGNIDVSNSDTTAFKDTTNPVTSFFAPGANQTYAFNRSVVEFSANGSFSTTQTLAYGGNNGRGAVLGANGLLYTVGNSNNGSGTPSQLTTSTGLEVATPGSTPNSTMIDPTFTSKPGDKAGKDSNFRGLTCFDGRLFFTKGSGSNGIDTVYQVGASGSLPTLANAAAAPIAVLPGFPTVLAKSATGVSHPFGLWFANASTLYVGDEGDGVAADLTNGIDPNSGLQKWILVNGAWKLAYTLKAGLNLGVNYTSTDGLGNNYFPAATDGLRRNIPETVAHLTGGEYFKLTNPANLERDLATISNHIPNRYVLSFQPQSPHPGLHAVTLSQAAVPAYPARSSTRACTLRERHPL